MILLRFLISVSLLVASTASAAAVSAVSRSDRVLLRRPKPPVRHNLGLLALKVTLQQDEEEGQHCS